MKRILGILAAATLPVVACVTVVSFAQQPEPASQGVVIKQTRVAQGPDGAPLPPPPLGDFLFVASEVSFGGKVVKGAPYSAEAVTETIQTLSDGNRIVNKVSSTVYRDSEGRTRRDQTLKGLGVLGSGGEPLQTIFINDPVAGTSFALDSRTHIAHKSAPYKIEWTGKPGVPAGAPIVEGQRFEFKVAAPGGSAGAPVIMTAPMAGPPPGAGPEIVGAAGQVTVATAGSGGMSYVFRRSSEDREVKEDLGEQLIDGVKATGTRTTVTIPVGEIGNERPIDIVNERWYSAELQMVVMTRHSDPRTGETTYKLTNINRTEPARSLFEVPSDYTVKEGLPGVHGAAGVKVRKPNPEE
jgi:hypothetical protein